MPPLYCQTPAASADIPLVVSSPPSVNGNNCRREGFSAPSQEAPDPHRRRVYRQSVAACGSGGLFARTAPEVAAGDRNAPAEAITSARNNGRNNPRNPAVTVLRANKKLQRLRAGVGCQGRFGSSFRAIRATWFAFQLNRCPVCRGVTLPNSSLTPPPCSELTSLRRERA